VQHSTLINDLQHTARVGPLHFLDLFHLKHQKINKESLNLTFFFESPCLFLLCCWTGLLGKGFCGACDWWRQRPSLGLDTIINDIKWPEDLAEDGGQRKDKEQGSDSDGNINSEDIVRKQVLRR
jgi:hypothetical protein